MTGFMMFVPGRPAPQGSKDAKAIYRGKGANRQFTGKIALVESSKALPAWRSQVAWQATQAWKWEPILTAVTVELDFIMPRPINTPKTTTPPAIKRPDIDKLERAILDSLTGVCWKDDSQVVNLHGTKRIAEIGELTGVRISIVWENHG